MTVAFRRLSQSICLRLELGLIFLSQFFYPALIPTCNPILVQNHANYGPLLLSNHGFVTNLCKSDLRYNKHKLRKNNGNLSNFYHPFSQGVNSLNFPDPLRVPLSSHFLILPNCPLPLFGKLFVARANLM